MTKEEKLLNESCENIRKADNQKINISLASEQEAIHNAPVIKDNPDLQTMEERRRILGSIIESLGSLGYTMDGETTLYSLEFDYEFLGERICLQMERGRI